MKLSTLELEMYIYVINVNKQKKGNQYMYVS